MSFVLCTDVEYLTIAKKLKNRYNHVDTAAGTRSFHSFVPIDNKTMEVRRYSSSEIRKIVDIID